MRRLLIALLLPLSACASPPAPAEWTPTTDPVELAARYNAFVETLDTAAVERRYPAAVEKLGSGERKTALEGVRTLAATGDVEVLPWIIPLLESEDPSVRIWTGSHLSQFVERAALERRDSRIPDAVVLLPRTDEELDLRPLASITYKMLQQPDDGNTYAYAARMIRYLRLYDLAPLLAPSLESRHPAVRRSAETALANLELQKAIEANSNREHPDVQRALGVIAELDARHSEEAAAWARAVTSPPPDPMSEQFLRAHPDVDGLSFEPPEAIDWEALAPTEYTNFSIEAPPQALRDQLAARLDMYGNAEVTFLSTAPSSLVDDHFYVIGDAGIYPLRIEGLRGVVRFSFSFDVDQLTIVDRIFYGTVLAKLPADAQPAGGFVIRAKLPTQQERDGSVAELTSAQYGSRPIRASYDFRTEDDEQFTFIRWQGGDTDCEYELSIFHGGREVSWNAFGCDV